MKTPEEILDEIAAENMINIQQMVTTKQLAVLAMRRYAKLYHDSEVKKLNIPAVSSSAKHTWKDEWRVCSGFEHHKKLLTDNHMINIRIRKDGKWHEIEADWLKRLVRQEFLGEE